MLKNKNKTGGITGGGAGSRQAAEQLRTKSGLLKVCSTEGHCSRGYPGQTPHGVSVPSGPAGSQKDRGCLSVAELVGIGTGKPATKTEPTEARSSG